MEPSPSSTSYSLSIIIMAFNEAENLHATFLDIYDLCTSQKYHFEIILINDGSTDETQKVAEEIASAYSNVRIYQHKSNLGLGEVYRSGLKIAANDLLTFFPADGQFAAKIIPDFYSKAHDFPIVLGTLQNKRSNLVGRILSLGERFLYRLLIGQIPKFQGILMLNRSMLKQIPLRSKGRGWAIVYELIIKAKQLSFAITHAPISVKPRRSGKSKVNNCRTIAANLRQLFYLAWILRRHDLKESRLN